MKVKKFISVITATITSIFTLMSNSNAIAETENGNAKVNTSNISVASTNSFGNMLVDEYLANQGDVNVDSGCNIFSLEISGNVASVSFETSQDCSLLVAIYDNDNDTMLASRVEEVTIEDEQKDVTITIDNMPQYYYACAYLIETDTLAPLCIAFKDTSHTKEIQEFLSKTTDDFGTKKILNFDSDQNNNFAVYNNDVYVFKETETSNIVTSVDFENDIYSFKDIEKTGFKKGDIIAVESLDNGPIILKVDYIISEFADAGMDYFTNGLDIKGQEIDIEEVFEYVKIDSSKSNSNVSSYTRSSVPAPLNAPHEVSSEINPKIKLDMFGISGSLELKIKPTVKFYFNKSIIPKYIEIMADAEAIVELATETEFEIPAYELGEFNVGMYGVNIGVDISVELGAEGKIATEFSFKTSYSLVYDADSSPTVKVITTKPEFNIQLKTEIEPYFAVSVKPNFNFIKEDVVSIGLPFKAGFGVKTETVMWELNEDDSIQHDCDHCIDGEIRYKSEYEAEVKIAGKKIPISQKTTIFSKKLKDFYYSFSYDEFGWGICPYIRYKVPVQVNDELGNQASDTEIICENQVLAKTDKNGKAEIWLKDGKYSLMAKKDESAAVKNITVHSPKNNIVLTLKKGNNAEVLAKRISLGRFNTGFLTEGGDLYTWGDNRFGALGIGSDDKAIYSPQLVMKDVKQFCMGDFTGAAVKNNGDLYMWGRNNRGQLGNKTTEDAIAPVKVLSNVREVQIDDYTSAAITNDGILYMWGSNFEGIAGVGDGSNWSDIYESSSGLGDVLEPTPVLVDVRKVFLDSSDATAAITEDGDLYVWGRDYSLPYRTGNYNNGSDVPKKIMSNIKSVCVGSGDLTYDHHAAAIDENGTLYTWGTNRDGELGNGTTEKSSVPIEIMDNVKQAIVGYGFTAAVTEDGELYTWGYNGTGKLGDGTKENHHTPNMIMEDIESIGCSRGIYYAIDIEGNLYVWGSSSYNMGAGSSYSSFDKPYKILENIIQVEFSWEHAAAVTFDGELYTWGNCAIGDGTYKSSYEPKKIEIPSINATMLLSGESPQIQLAEFISSFEDDETIQSYVYNVYQIKKPANGNKLSNENLISIHQEFGNGSGLLDGSLYWETVRVPMKSTLVGDANNDRTVNVADAVMLQKWLLGSGDLICWKNVDLCADEKINIFDMVMMRRLLIESK